MIWQFCLLKVYIDNGISFTSREHYGNFIDISALLSYNL